MSPGCVVKVVLLVPGLKFVKASTGAFLDSQSLPAISFHKPSLVASSGPLVCQRPQGVGQMATSATRRAILIAALALWIDLPHADGLVPSGLGAAQRAHSLLSRNGGVAGACPRHTAPAATCPRLPYTDHSQRNAAIRLAMNHAELPLGVDAQVSPGEPADRSSLGRTKKPSSRELVRSCKWPDTGRAWQISPCICLIRVRMDVRRRPSCVLCSKQTRVQTRSRRTQWCWRCSDETGRGFS